MARNYYKEKQLHFGLDYLSIYGTCNLEKEFEKLNFTNSNYGEIEDYIYQKNDIKLFEYGITFNYKGYPVFLYVKGDPFANFPSRNCITVYGVAFKILDLDEIRYFLEGYFSLDKVKRFDICMDLEDDILNVLKKFNKLSQKGGEIYGTGGKTETKYIGNPKKAENRRQLIRIYNKIEDLKGSNKESLYQDYLIKDSVTRVELEVRRELARNINYESLFIESNLKGIFKNYFRSHTKIFDTIEEDKITLYRKAELITDEEKQGMYYKNLYKRAFIGYSKNIMKSGTCPIKILIGEGLVQESTKIELGRKKINKIRRKEKAIKDKYLSLKKDKYEK